MAIKKTAKKADPRKAEWAKHLKAYEEKNPVKYAAKKEAGAFDEIPNSFTGGDHLKVIN